jgi:ubiquinone/menaquinone biosynthesis C-methylase UbiE
VHTDRFTERARAYAATRPVHPPASIAYVLEGFGDPSKLHVADLGAGTGLSSRPIADAGPAVWAVEPNAAMRDAAEPHPRVTMVDASAERTTLPDACADIVTACTAWHWFDHALAVPEVLRILKSRGRLAIMEIHFDESDPFTKGWRDAFWRFGKRVPLMPGNLIDYAKAINHNAVTNETFAFAQTLDRAGLHAYTDSNSLAPKDGELYDGLHAAIDVLVDEFGSPPAVALQRFSSVTRIER